MKTYCKQNLFTDREFCLEKVKETFKGKWNRRDYQKALCHYCKMNKKQVRELIKENNKEAFNEGLYRIVDEFQEEVKNRHFIFEEIKYKNHADGISGKIRLIGIESVKQQCFEHIIVGMLMPLFNAKIEEHQYASIKGRGQVAGMKRIAQWVINDDWAMKCAIKHREKCSRKTQYFVKLDIKKCFPSMTIEVVMKFFKHDISKNKDLIWAIEEILKWHIQGGHGLIIGSLLSQFICNYLMSYVYRYAKSLHKIRRNKKVKMITYTLFFMDDILLFSSDRRNLKLAVNSIIKYINNELNLKVKPNWHIKNIQQEPVHMMGYVIHSDGYVTIRPRIFLRLRHVYLRARLKRNFGIKFARKIVAYNSYLVHTNSCNVRKKLKVKYINNKARKAIRRYQING